MKDLERQMMELSSRMGPKLIGPGVMSNRETEKLGGMLKHSMDDGTQMPGANHAEYEAMMALKQFQMSDREPKMQERSPENQMFTIQNEIDSLTNEYDMNVRNQQYEQAQEIADVIDQLQQQKIAIQARVGDQQMMSEQSTSGGIGAFAGGGGVEEVMSEQMMPEEMMSEEMMPEMGQEQAMGEFEMSKQELMNELFIPLAENGYEKEVMAILENPIDSEESTEAQRILSQVLSQEADFNINDFLLAVSMVAPQ